MSLFSWTIGVRDHSTSGFAPSYDEALARIREYLKHYRSFNVPVLSYSIDDPDGVTQLSMDTSHA